MIKNREIGIVNWPQSQPALKENAIRYASVLLNRDKVDLPKSANDDEIEVVSAHGIPPVKAAHSSG